MERIVGSCGVIPRECARRYPRGRGRAASGKLGGVSMVGVGGGGEFRNRTNGNPKSEIRNPKSQIGPSVLRFRISDLRFPFVRFQDFPRGVVLNKKTLT